MNGIVASKKRDRIMMGGLFALGVASRIPFRSTILYHWDSVNLALATQSFDLSMGQPHPPGYIVYVGWAKMLNLLTRDPQISLVTLSVVFSGLTAVAIFWLGKEMFSALTGLVAALFLLTSPLVWFYGEVALPHVVDAFLVTLSALLLFKIVRGEERHGMLAATVLGVAGGVRPQTLLFLLPLIVFAFAKVQRKSLAVDALVLIGVCLLWFVPLILLTGGLQRYADLLASFSARFAASTSIFLQGGAIGMFNNTEKLVRYTLYAWGLAILAPVVYLLHERPRAGTILSSQKTRFLLIWASPAIAFYVLIHMGQQGLVFVFLPVLLLVSAESWARLHALLLGERQRWILQLQLTTVLLGNAAIFLLAPEFILPGNRFKILSWDTIKNLDAYHNTRIATIKELFPPEKTLVVADRWRHAGYYLPQYPLIPLEMASAQETTASSTVPAAAQRTVELWDVPWEGAAPEMALVVLYDDGLGEYLEDSSMAEAVTTEGGQQLYYLTWREGQILSYGPGGIGLTERESRASH